MTRFIGIDAHKKSLEYCCLDAEGTRLARGRCAATREAIERFAREVLQREDQIAIEATTHTWAIVDLLAPHVAKVVVSNPLSTRAIAAAKVKTDRIDARVLADLLRSGYLPEVWQPDAETRRLRSLSHRRSALVSDRTAVKNRLHSTLAERLITVPYAELFSTQGQEWLASLELDEDGRKQLDSDLRLLAALEREIEAFDEKLAKLAWRRQPVRVLMTLPGFDVTVAQGLLAAWGDISRFPDADRAAAYLGLAPSTRQSGEHCYHGRITKQGNSHARWLLIQAAQHLDKNPGPLGHFFRRLSRKKNRNVAVVATARKLATIAYHMLCHDEPYRYALPRTTQTKLAKLRVKATGTRRKGGLAKGSKRPDSYGSGVRTRRIPALHDLCDKENLPLPTLPEQLTQGERRVLERLGILDSVEALYRERRENRATGNDNRAAS